MADASYGASVRRLILPSPSSTSRIMTPIFTPSMLRAKPEIESRSSSVTVKAASSFLGIVQTPTSPPA